MFDWLKSEVKSVPGRWFYLIDGPAPTTLRQTIEESNLPIPPSYKNFVLEFGNAKLYRQGGVYLVQVFASLSETSTKNGEALLHFGRTDRSLVYFKKSLLAPNSESPVFEWTKDGGLRKSANSFEEWLLRKCRNAKRAFNRKQWLEIKRGPAPFSDREIGVIRARRQFRWRVVGIAADGDLQFEVFNGSDIVLPYLTIGVRGRRGEVDGSIWLPVSTIQPGETRTIKKDCYKNLLLPTEVCTFEKADPEPEDRDRYWEFKQI